MADQENPRNGMPAEAGEGSEDGLEKAKTEVKAGSKRARVDDKAKHKAEQALAAAQLSAELDRPARIKTEEALTKAQQAPTNTSSTLGQEQQARVEAEKGKANIETTLEKTSTTIMETPSKTFEKQGADWRTSFIVRLTVDERGKPKRTEIEHTNTRQKESHPALDGEQLTAFIRACISTIAAAEPAISQTPLAVPVGVLNSEHETQTPSPNVSNVGIFRTGVPDTMALTLSPEETFVVQVRFQLQNAETIPLAAQESAYEITIYANKVAGESKLLTSYSGNLVKDILEYEVQIDVPGLSPGFYRLVTLVTLQKPINTPGYHEGPIFQVS